MPLPPALKQKVMAYVPEAYNIVSEMFWYSFLIREGYSKKLAREHAIYHMIENGVQKMTFALEKPS